jgi:hypothetical protein
MKTLLAISRALFGISFLFLLVLGVLIWSGHALGWIPIHMMAGIVYVLALWTMAIACARLGAPAPLVVFTILWGALLAGLGWAQTSLVPGPNHWIIKVVHLLFALVAMALGGSLTNHVRQRLEPQSPFVGRHHVPQPGRP